MTVANKDFTQGDLAQGDLTQSFSRRRMSNRAVLFIGLLVGSWITVLQLEAQQVVALPGTKPLTMSGDITQELVAGVDRFLLRELDKSIANRARFWNRDFSSWTKYSESVDENRTRLKRILGIRGDYSQVTELQLMATTSRPALVGVTERFKAYEVRWNAIGDIHGEGVLLVPTGEIRANIVAIPDADQTPEMLAGLAVGTAEESQFARRLAQSGYRVLIPSLIDRTLEVRQGHSTITSREFLYRSAFELGRHLIGYEIQKIGAGIGWLESCPEGVDGKLSIGVIGWGEGGMLALYAAAVDPRIDAVCVSGFFSSRQHLWEEPIDRNVFGLLEQFGDAEIATLIAPRTLVVEAAKGPELELPSKGGAPARLVTPSLAEVLSERQRVDALMRGQDGEGKDRWSIAFIATQDGTGPAGSHAALSALVQGLGRDGEGDIVRELSPYSNSQKTFDSKGRQARQLHEIDRHNQLLLRESSYVRQNFMKNIRTNTLAEFQDSAESYREYFKNEVVGHFDQPLASPKVRSRRSYDERLWTGYEVVMDVFPDVIAYGILLIPKDIKPGDRRPVVVCQHGLEGRPQDVVSGDHRAYHDFAAKLAERGFVTFAPQNLYIFRDRFRTLQRKANPIKKTLFSVIVPQHQQILNWLMSLDFVDKERIAFYGLSYGGKSAMRIPPLVPDYCLSICSADFNEWVWKNASTRSPYSYATRGEYEIFEWDLGSTFNYAEMATLIAPRPFMVERGHHDGVAPDEKVAHEFAKVRRRYVELGIGDRCELEWFDGPHTIHGVGTFDFLHKHLNHPKSIVGGRR